MIKTQYELIPVEFDDLVLVAMNGAKKYKPKGWEEGIDFDKDKNLASVKRHINDYRNGNKEDLESKLHPLLHAAFRLMMQYTLDKRSNTESKTDMEKQAEYYLATWESRKNKDSQLEPIITESTKKVELGIYDDQPKKGWSMGFVNDSIPKYSCKVTKSQINKPGRSVLHQDLYNNKKRKLNLELMKISEYKTDSTFNDESEC